MHFSFIGLGSLVYIAIYSFNSQSYAQNKKRQSQSYANSSYLAQTSMVYLVQLAECSLIILHIAPHLSQEGKKILHSNLTVLCQSFTGLETTSEEVKIVLLQSRKQSTRYTYSQKWTTFVCL